MPQTARPGTLNLKSQTFMLEYSSCYRDEKFLEVLYSLMLLRDIFPLSKSEWRM